MMSAFNMSKTESFFYHHRPRITIACAAVVLYWAEPTIISMLVGAVVVLLGEAGRTWASGYIDKDQKLATSGPYAFSRNPLYVFNFTMFVGFCAMSANLVVAIATMVAFLLIYIPVIRIEASKMVHLFGNDYARWSENVPLFFPRLTPYKGEDQRKHSFKLVFEHREHIHWCTVSLALVLFYGFYCIKTYYLAAT
ncbi:MAG: isoprenylcysteine carboxylmethyltransferase family protein [Mariprofundaceae bacterium]